jgi:transcriptional regulator with XRE-family HTH domain
LDVVGKATSHQLSNRVLCRIGGALECKKGLPERRGHDLGGHRFFQPIRFCCEMDLHHVAFGALLRRWRERRRMTQTELALAAESSTRHLSCLETGRAQSSRDMVMRLSEFLNIPLRDRNTLLLAAGFAPPAFTERSVDGLASAKTAIESVLRVHSPFLAFAVDRHWNVVCRMQLLCLNSTRVAHRSCYASQLMRFALFSIPLVWVRGLSILSPGERT